MSSRTDPSLQDRLTLAANAKSAMLTRFKRAQDPNNPVAIENRRQREREAPEGARTVHIFVSERLAPGWPPLRGYEQRLVRVPSKSWGPHIDLWNVC
jgi:hypothetical protein